jgi:2-polyprenyl-3-methyl-5-hydroxy-6-metoxy-1,4-benzoquinol methylase
MRTHDAKDHEAGGMTSKDARGDDMRSADSAPSLIRRLLSRSGAMTFENRSEAAEATLRNPRLMRVARLVQRHLQGSDVLDVGCWTGGLAWTLTSVVPGAYTRVDIEPAAQAVDAARTRATGQRFLVVSSVEALPFEARSFDIVVLTEVMEHVPVGREVPLLAELARVLRPHGSIILSTPVCNVLNPLDPAWFFGHRHYSLSRLAILAQQSGLTMRDIEFTGGVWTVLDTNLLYFYKHVLHRPYVTPQWLYHRVQREYIEPQRSAVATTIWCRLVL